MGISIDNEITNFVKQAEINAKHIIESHIDELHCLAENLLEYETVDSLNFKKYIDNMEIEKDEDGQN